ncbi:putative glycosyltransferase EpsJ [Thomasclavelia cocleata]|uniref:Putative glycosyltransferase EpsJ n=1 Tax=Thomasclavelia cocleata TaxID=69824 RepID=A0A829ZAF1_9FIRM|nr:glycosyltransferase family 2 protein [Thomasclavelia cocleata]GFI40945.1 putative glycosyltransferase EpsJ [Thomasclavelia cocleata]
MNDLISVIIPVYNVEKYLHRCVDSVINQTYSNLEIILVDDGSTDTSSQICDEYKNLDERIVVIHKENGGLSDARNVGFDISKGEYILFLDSDDWMEKEAVDLLKLKMEEYQVDVVQSNFLYKYEDNHEINGLKILGQDQVLNNFSAMEQLIKNETIKNFAWGKLYKRKLLEGIKFPYGKLFEDTYWIHQVFARASNILLLDIPLFNYWQRCNSISYSFSIKKLDILDGYLERRIFIKDKYPKLSGALDNGIIRLALSIYLLSIKNYRFNQHNKIKRKLKKICKQIRNEKQVTDEKLKKDLNLFCSCSVFYLLQIVFKRWCYRK